VKRVWQQLKDFWCAEEVPRWFGLTLVAAYVVGLAALAYASHRQMQDTYLTSTVQSHKSAVRFLADELATTTRDRGPSAESTLRRFALAHGCSELRIYDEKLNVLDSMNRTEVSKRLRDRSGAPQKTPQKLVTYRLSDDTRSRSAALLRMPIANSANASPRYLEAVFDIQAISPIQHTLQVCALIVSLVATTVFFLLYRRLRRHFHSVSRIARHLADAEDIEQQLDQLHLRDGTDALAVGWNRLVELALELRESVDRSKASSELLEALDATRQGELAEAMTTVPLGVMLLSENGHVDYCNGLASRVCNWSEQGLPPHDSQMDDENTPTSMRIARVIHQCMHDRGARRTVDAQIAAANDSYYHVRVVPIQTRQRMRRYVVLITDVSQQVRADIAREEFVSQVTHELRTPLTNIRAYAETLSSGIFDDPKVITECYNVIMKETRRLSRLIEDILSISQLEVGTMQLVLDKVDLGELLNDGVRDVRGIAESKTIALQIDLPPKLDPIQADRDKIAVVVNNLLGNALKYTPDGGQVYLSCKTRDNEVQIAVKDTGIGIDEKDHDRVFEKFQRSSDAEVQNQTGTGIGLTTALEIVRQHGGDITLHSRKGEGSTFTVHLPLKSQGASSPAAATR